MTEPPHPSGSPRIFTPDYYARLRALERDSWWNAGMRDAAAHLLSLAALPSRGRLLDAGCGSGQTMDWFMGGYPDWEALGVDLASEGLAAAVVDPWRHIVRASVLMLPVADASMDLVITLDVLQHLPLDGGDGRALAEMARVLKPGGHLLVRTNGQSFPRTADDPVFDFHKYEPAELRHRLTAAGFRVVRLGRLNALLGLAEIPRELRARTEPHSYHGVLSQARPGPAWSAKLKRAWLGFEGRLVRHGASLPLGRSILALCQR